MAANNHKPQFIQAYGEDFLEYLGVKYNHSAIISPNLAVEEWNIHRPLISDDFLILSKYSAIILIGTGNKHVQLSPQLLASLYHKGLAAEVMSTPAACRTFNILAEEGRNVVAALIVGNI